MKKDRILRLCVTAALMAGGVWAMGVPGVDAKNFDMTSGKYANGITYTDPDSDVGTASDPNCYNYKYEASTGKVIGGNIKVESNENNLNFYTALRISKSDVAGLDVTDQKKVLKLLAEKYVTSSNVYADWDYATKKFAYVQIVDDTGKGDPQVLRSYKIKWRSYSNEISNVDEQVSGVYTTTIRNDGTGNTEYDFSKDGTWYKSGAAIDINIKPEKKSEDDVYAFMRTDAGRNVGISCTDGGRGLYPDTLNGAVDASGQSGSKAYGIYDNTGSQATMESYDATIKVTGDVSATGILAENKTGDAISNVVIGPANKGSNIRFLLNGNKTTGIEAGKNGQVSGHTVQSDGRWGGTVDVSSPHGYSLYAHDGGKITLNSVNVDEGTGIYAEKGGQIKVNNLSGKVGSINTDDDENSKIDVTIAGNANGDIRGHSTVSVKGTLTGDDYGNGVLTIGGTWNGSLKNKEGSVSFAEGGQWNVGNDTVSEITKLTGSDSAIQRGYINMNSHDLTIDKFSGNATFVYGHDENNPEKLTGGKVIIKSAEPLTIYSTGIGVSGPTQTVSSTIDSTITMATSSAGIKDLDTAKKVLDELAAKAYYQAYSAGERNLTGTAEIQEGLTSSSISKYLGAIRWSDTDGQGSIFNIRQPYSQIITGNLTKDTAYSDKYDSATHTYNFNEDTDIVVKVHDDPRTPGGGTLYIGAVTNWGDQWLMKRGNQTIVGTNANDGPSYTIDMHGHNLYIDMEGWPTPGTTGSQPYWFNYGIVASREGTIAINNPGTLKIDCNANYYYGSCIRAATARDTAHGAHVVINNDSTSEHAVVMRGGIPTPAYELDYWTIAAEGNKTSDKYTPEEIYRYDNTVDIKGLVDVETLSGAAAIMGKGGHITIGGGRIVAKNYPAIMTRSKTTTVNLNMLVDDDGHIQGTGSNNLVLKGDAETNSAYWGGGGTINMAFVTDKSEFDGQYYGHTGGIDGAQNLWLANGAVWNNGPQLMHDWSSQKDNATDNASIVTHFHGGSSLDKAGNIFQTSAKDITFENMDGFVNVYMKHGDSSPSDFSALGNIFVEKASKTDGVNSHIRMITSGVTAADMVKDNTVKEVLNALAGKLYYKAYVNGENNLDATAEIAESLTTSSFTYRMGNVSFKKNNGQGEISGDITKQYPANQQLADQAEAITGSDASEEYYKEQGILNKEGVYDFSLNPSSVTVSKATASIDESDAAAAVAAQNKDIIIRADNATAAFSATGSDSLKAAGMYSTNGKIINATGGTIRVTGDGRGDADALLADKGSININTEGEGKTDIKGNMTARETLIKWAFYKR